MKNTYNTLAALALLPVIVGIAHGKAKIFGAHLHCALCDISPSNWVLISIASIAASLVLCAVADKEAAA